MPTPTPRETRAIHGEEGSGCAPPASRQCAKCGADFRPRHKTSAYCSVPCARKKNGGKNAKPESWWINGRGYIEGRIWTAQGQRRVKQHRFIVECAIGRRLLPNEDVHHVNGDKQDNRLTNLVLISHGKHSVVTNSERKYRRGYKLDLPEAERQRRRDHMAALGRKFGAANSPFSKGSSRDR